MTIPDRKRITPVILAGCAVLCLEAGSYTATRLARRRGRELQHAAALRDAPPLLTFTVVTLGGFRGLIADILWLRAARLQEAGRFIELAQLADWIAKLQPRCTEIWSYQAWNLAYNISVMMPVPEDKWRWVCNGIRLLRDEGIRYNPDDPQLYAELGWLFQHKIGANADRDHWLYKARWAVAMTELLGGGYPAYETLAADADRVARMRKEFGLEPEIMQEIDRRYGRLDWRVPETHAVYWAYRGRLQAGPESAVSCDRMVFSALANMVFYGRLTFDPDKALYELTPAPELILGTTEAFEFAMRKHKQKYIREAYSNFLRNAVLLLAALDRQSEARNLFAKWQRTFPAPENEVKFETFLAQAQQERNGS